MSRERKIGSIRFEQLPNLGQINWKTIADLAKNIPWGTVAPMAKQWLQSMGVG